MDVVDDFPYRAEYAKSSRASCRKCQGNIGKGSLRLAVLVQSPSFDGKIPHWYHYICFFIKQHPKSVQDIAHFDSLRWDDQKQIKEKIENGGSSALQGSKKSGKKAKKVDNDFLMEYAKSSRAECKGCQEKIGKGDIRISKKDYSSEKAKRFGPIPMWHHVECFLNVRNELEFFEDAESIPGFNTLSADDKKMLRGKIKKIEGKRKAEDEPDRAAKKQKTDDELLQEKQNKKLFYYRDLLQKNLKKAELASLLEHNGYEGLSGEDKMLDVLSDLMTFGTIDTCSVCKEGNLIYRFGVGYLCRGNLTEWTKCTNVVETPKRKPFIIPSDFKEAFEFLNKYKYKKYGDRLITKRENLGDLATSNSTTTSPPKPLENLVFCILGSKFETDKKTIEKNIKSLGGQVSSKVEATTAAIITTADMIGGKSKHMKTAKTLGIECVTEDFLNEVEPDGALLMIKKKNIAPWDSTVENRLDKLTKCKSSYKSKSKSGGKSSYELDLPETVNITLKNGDYIDPKSGLADSCHVYKRDGKNYTVVLGMVDLSKGINSYYRLQILESDKKNKWYLFRSWGRIGTKVGDQKVEKMDNLMDALLEFKSLFEKKTGNKFTDDLQKKRPGMWYPLDVVFGEEAKLKKLEPGKSKSKLPIPIQDLIYLLFDVDAMKSTMVNFELDLKKMPLGKLSPKQLESAYKVLSEAMEWIEKQDQKEGDKKKTDPTTIKSHLLDCSNRFYTLIPHDFGMKNPPLLDNEELIKSKIEMIDSLREIELAYSLLKSEDGAGDQDPIDLHYKQLKTNMEVLDKSSDEFNMIKNYLKNTHAATHSHYTLELDEVFKIEREGEAKRFKPFKKLPNRQLLWHGSRLTNFVGILSQGLRIAPPEAPATGYMFGKGVYFADMVSKSANYCFTSETNNTGLLLLSDVALGDMYELTDAKYITKLPSGKHSTKGQGQTCPDPTQTVTLDDGVKVPLGAPQKTDIKHSSLLYNEYIVYDVSQINMKYLLRTTFKYSY